MKKAINVLCILSVCAIVALLCLSVCWGNKTEATRFIYEWIMGVLVMLAIPLMLGRFSLAVNRDKLKPQSWLAIYGVLLCGYTLLLLHVGLWERTLDMPHAIREDYQSAYGTPQIVEVTKSKEIVLIQGVEVYIALEKFEIANERDTYEFVYLPNSLYLIDMLDANGDSLKK